jgi:Zn finger protein HypA/HybF involved in hydrogenase expression
MKAGTKEYFSEYYKQNKEKHQNNMIEWKKENKTSTLNSIKKYQEKNIDKVREWNRLNKQKQRQERRQFIDECKSTCSCKKCGDIRSYVLDFHHINPDEKEFDLGEASKYSIPRLKLELEKCITLCRNCHSEFHYLEKQQDISIEKYLQNST